MAKYYLVSGSRKKSGEIFSNIDDAYKEMNRQMMKGSRESGILELNKLPKKKRY